MWAHHFDHREIHPLHGVQYIRPAGGDNDRFARSSVCAYTKHPYLTSPHAAAHDAAVLIPRNGHNQASMGMDNAMKSAATITNPASAATIINGTRQPFIAVASFPGAPAAWPRQSATRAPP